MGLFLDLANYSVNETCVTFKTSKSGEECEKVKLISNTS